MPKSFTIRCPITVINPASFIFFSIIFSLALVVFNISWSLNSSLLHNGSSSSGINTISSSSQRIQELQLEVRNLRNLIHAQRQVPAPHLHGLVIPDGPAVAMPSIRTTEEEEASIKRKFYGGRGDKAHLGGFTSFDPNGISPTLWKEMVSWLGVKSLVDVGCGRGISTSWFVLHGMDYVVCVEGSHDAVANSLLHGLQPQEGTEFELVEHDFSLGPWWPSRTVDAAWCVEFTEHVGRNYQLNYFASFRKAAYIFMTHSQRGGWHHVEVHDSDWWILRMESMGFVYSEYLTKKMRQVALKDWKRNDFLRAMQNNKKKNTFGVYMNPLVASLPQHAHLLTEHGCFASGEGGIECGKVGSKVQNLTPLPDSYKPVVLSDKMDKAWMDLIYDLPLPGQGLDPDENVVIVAE
eukprot:CCRYP_000714-RD/>CCRYP_000714-RD protein AED:0.10 eAED:0.10 QI:147/0.75/0.8/1/0.75/0.8/5/211/406